jgi:threonine dehydratase
LGAEIYFKCENLQRTGAFKVRGAFNSALSLDAKQLAKGLITTSSGNQAAAVSMVARDLGTTAHVIMPRIANKAKVAAVERLGGIIHWLGLEGKVPTAAEYDEAARRAVTETGGTYIHPYNQVETIAGQGTCALELLEEIPGVDAIMAPVGGGGLISGTIIASDAHTRRPRVVGCEPSGADDAYRSLAAGRFVPQTGPNTIADGLRTSLGDITYPIIRRGLSEILLASESEIVEAMRLFWDVTKMIVEASSAVPIAALLRNRSEFRGSVVGVIISGGNVDLDHLPWAESKGSN